MLFKSYFNSISNLTVIQIQLSAFEIQIVFEVNQARHILSEINFDTSFQAVALRATTATTALPVVSLAFYCAVCIQVASAGERYHYHR